MERNEEHYLLPPFVSFAGRGTKVAITNFPIIALDPLQSCSLPRNRDRKQFGEKCNNKRKKLHLLSKQRAFHAVLYSLAAYASLSTWDMRVPIDITLLQKETAMNRLKRHLLFGSKTI